MGDDEFRNEADIDIDEATKRLLFNAVKGGDVEEFEKSIRDFIGKQTMSEDLDKVITYLLNCCVDEDQRNLLHAAVIALADAERKDCKDEHDNATNANVLKQKKMLATLIDFGIDPNHSDDEGWTCLHSASSLGSILATRLLVSSTQTTSLSTEGKKDKGIRKKGADVRLSTHSGSTPLHYAAGKGFLEISKILVDYGADVNAQDAYGSTPLARASGKGRADVVKYLLEHSADPLISEKKTGDTPLHNAVISQHADICMILIEKEPRLLDIENAEGKIAFCYATDTFANLLRLKKTEQDEEDL